LRICSPDPPLNCPRCLVRGLGRFELFAISDEAKLKGAGKAGRSVPRRRPARRSAAVQIEQTVIWAESRQITVSGELDLAGVAFLRRACAETVGAGLPCVVLELSGCEYLDAAALGVIVGLERRLAANGQELIVDGATGQVARMIALARAFSP
jgi:anti-anti-sigma factor